MTDPVVSRNEEVGRYEIHVDGELAGFSDFVEITGTIDFTHTETLPEFSGQGLGLELTRAAIADAVANDKTIIPSCPFVRRYLETHEVPGADVSFPDRQ